MTLIHVLVFTTPDKRGRIIFNCIVAGLLLEVVRNFIGIWSVTRSGTNSSYFLLTLPTNAVNESDAENLDAANKYTNFSLGANVNDTMNEITSLLAFVAVQICFYVLVHTMMSAMRRKTIRIATFSLAGLGCHAVIWRLVQVVWNTINLFQQTSTFAPPEAVQLGTSIAYTVSVCAWCLVYGYLIIRSALTRIRMGLEFKRGEARHMMFMTALESMIIPRTFA
jgi:Fungal pheromone mating factor STE2 GPCR